MKRSELRTMVLQEMRRMRAEAEPDSFADRAEKRKAKLGIEADMPRPNKRDRMEAMRQQKIKQAQEQQLTHESPLDDLAEVTGNSKVDKILADILDLMRQWRQAASESGADPQLLKKYSAAVKAFRKAVM